MINLNDTIRDQILLTQIQSRDKDNPNEDTSHDSEGSNVVTSDEDMPDNPELLFGK